MRIENSFIPVTGVGPQTERALWEAGITRWEHFDPGCSVVGSTRAKRIETFIDRAQDRLAAGDAAFFRQTLPSDTHWRFYENVRPDTVFLDIETTGLDHDRHRVTTVSLHQAGETTTLVRGQDLTTRRLAGELADARLLVIFNGRHFDVPFLEQSFDLSIDLPHADLWSLNRQLGYSGGLDDVEQRLGIERERPDISGADAVRLWKEYETGRERSLETLIEYNREDTRNMVPIMEQFCAQLHEEVFASVCPE